MPRPSRNANVVPIETKIKFLSTNYKRYGRLRTGHSNAIQVLHVEDQALQFWNLNRTASNLKLLYSHPIQSMNETEAEFFNLDAGKFGVQSPSILTFRNVLCNRLNLNCSDLRQFAQYIDFCKRHLVRDYVEALSDCQHSQGDLSEFLQAQRAWSGATRQFELKCLGINVNRCNQCKTINVYKPGCFSGLCSMCKDHAQSLLNREARDPAPVNMYSKDNWAVPPAALPGAALLSDDEQAALSPILPYIRILKSKTCSRGKVYGHSFIAPQDISGIVRALPRLPVEIQYAQINDSNSNIEWSINVPRIVYMMSVMSENNVLNSVFAAHGVQLYGAECSARLQEWDQSTTFVPRINVIAGTDDDNLQEFCTEDYLPNDGYDREVVAVEYGPDRNQETDSELPRSSASFIHEPASSRSDQDGISIVLQQFNSNSNGSNVAYISSGIRGDGFVPDSQPDLFNLCFPYLILGKADFFYSLEGRPIAFNSRHMWLKHIMGSDSRFCTNKMFVFVVQHWIQKAQVFSTASVFMKKQSLTAQKSMEEIQTDLEQGDFSALNDIITFSRSIQGSVPYWRDVRDKVKEFFDWKCLQELPEHSRKFHQNVSGFPNPIEDCDLEFDLTVEEANLVSEQVSILSVRHAAASERKWGFQPQNVDYEENTQAALAFFLEPLEQLSEHVFNYLSLTGWEVHTLHSVLRVKMFDTTLPLVQRARHALLMCRLQFVSMYSELDSHACRCLLVYWHDTMAALDEEVEMFLRGHPPIACDVDTPMGAYVRHSENFAILFRERSFQLISAANPAFFITGSMAEMHWPELWEVMHAYVRLDNDGSDPWLVNVKLHGFSKSSDKAEALKRFPHVSSSLFTLRTELLFEIVLGPVLGIDDKIIRYEFADGRGEIHFHSLNWSSKWPIGLLVEEQNDDHIIKFARAWLRLSALHPSDDVNRQKYHEYANPTGDKNSFSGPAHPSKQFFTLLDPNDVFEWDIRMCNANFCHSCIGNAYCLRSIRGRNGAGYTGPGAPGDRCHYCRYDFHVNDWTGKDDVSVADAEIKNKTKHSIPELSMERNSRMMIQHSKFFRRVWKANCDFSVIVDPDPSKIQGYIVSYLCKEGVATSEYKSFFRSMVFNDDIADVTNLVKKVMLRILGHRDKSAQEVFFTATGHQLYHISAKKGIVINLGDMRRALSKTSFLGSNIVDKYITSKVWESGVSLYEYAQSQQEGYVTLSGSKTYCCWPLSERYCEVTLLLHNPWNQAMSVLRSSCGGFDFPSHRSKFMHDFLFTHNCPKLVYSQVMFAKLLHDRPELRPRNHFSLQDAGTGPLQTFLRSFGNRSLEADIQSCQGMDIKFPAAPPGWDWSSTANWGDLCDIDLENVQAMTTYQSSDMRTVATLDSMLPLSERTLSNPDQWQTLNIAVQHCWNCFNGFQGTSTLKLIMHGAGGTGKSYVIKTLTASIVAMTGDPKSVVVLTPTGAAASQVAGETIHRGLGINPYGNTCSRQRIAELCSELSTLKVLIIDEMSMLDAGMLFTVQDRLCFLRSSMGHDSWNGLWCVILSGDFMQLPPVKGTSLYCLHNSTTETHRNGQVLFRQFDNCMILTKSERLSEQAIGLGKVLDNLRTGDNLDETLQLINSRVISLLHVEERTEFVSHETMHFVAYNVDRIQRNLEHLQHVEGPVAPVLSDDIGNKRHLNAYDSSAHFCGLQRSLWLGKGVRVTLCLNICTKLKLTKGCTGTIQCVYYVPGTNPPQLPAFVLVRLDSDVLPFLANAVSSLPIHKNTLPFAPIKIRCELGCCYRRQLPFELCASLTIHKSQGATVCSPTLINLTSKAESNWPGIIYTGLSRFTSLDKFALPSPLTRDALVVNRRNLYSSGRIQAIDRLKRIHSETLARHVTCTSMEQYQRLMNTLLDIERARENLQQ